MGREELSVNKSEIKVTCNTFCNVLKRCVSSIYCVSSNRSLILERKAGGTASTMSLHEERDEQTQTAASAVSLKSADSMREPPVLSDGTVTSDPK